MLTSSKAEMSTVEPFLVIIVKGNAEVLVCLVRDARSTLVADVKLILLAVVPSSLKLVNAVNAPKSTEVIFVS